MDPMIGTGLILALIPLYQRERDKAKQASKEDFYQWLIEHKFQDVKDCITNNFQLSTEIERILRLNQEALISRFDEVDQKLFCIMNSMSEFRGLIQEVAPRAILTEQEESILCQFVESGEETLERRLPYEAPKIWHLGLKKELKVKRQNVIESSFRKLAILGFLFERYKSNGEAFYQLTEEAYYYVNNLKDSDISSQAKSILKQYADSGVVYLASIISSQGSMVQAENTPIELDNPRMLVDDLSVLEDHGYITFDGDVAMGKRYTLTHKGNEYAKSME
jgi:DNA-binding PadR family transcriptional regulator